MGWTSKDFIQYLTFIFELDLRAGVITGECDTPCCDDAHVYQLLFDFKQIRNYGPDSWLWQPF